MVQGAPPPANAEPGTPEQTWNPEPGTWNPTSSTRSRGTTRNQEPRNKPGTRNLEPGTQPRPRPVFARYPIDSAIGTRSATGSSLLAIAQRHRRRTRWRRPTSWASMSSGGGRGRARRDGRRQCRSWRTAARDRTRDLQRETPGFGPTLPGLRHDKSGIVDLGDRSRLSAHGVCDRGRESGALRPLHRG